jgi:hypothetical protein
MWCATCLDGARQRLPGGSALAPFPSVTSPPGSSFCSPPTSPAGWRCRSHLSSCCCWRSLAFNFILQAAIFAHLCEMFVGVAPCTSLFRHFFVLVKSGKAKDHLDAYYF